MYCIISTITYVGNICTAQALLANMAAFYAVYHGPEGLKKIAARIHGMAVVTAEILTLEGFKVVNKDAFFDTLLIDVSSKKGTITSAKIQEDAINLGLNIRVIDNNMVGISFGEAITKQDTIHLLTAFGVKNPTQAISVVTNSNNYHMNTISTNLQRTTEILTHPVFNTHHSETQMLRYLKSLEQKDLSLNWSMISLGK